MPEIENLLPVEDVGRDTISRFEMQFQAAAYAALEILEGSGVDCVYCDYHDDFVVRRNIAGKVTYHFFQVKTKKKLNDQWSLNDIFGITTKRVKKTEEQKITDVRDSFAGKLILHGIVFSESCDEVTLISNVHFSNDVVSIIDEIKGISPKSKATTFLSDNFAAIFSLEDPVDPKHKVALEKISLRPAVRYMDQSRDAFATEARSAIYKYSEIDLTYQEITELANGLVDLVHKKSRTKLSGITPEDIRLHTGVQLNDLLSILSISKSVFESINAGDDPNAIKTASVIQRWYTRAGADASMIEFAAQQKVNWDIWLRTNRHIYPQLELEILLTKINTLFNEWQKSGGVFDNLSEMIDQFMQESFVAKFSDITNPLLFGAINAVLVKRGNQ